MTTRGRWLIRLFSLAGLGFAGGSAYVHYRLLTDPTYVSPCDINQVFNCSQLYLSRYGSIGGVPVALGGIVWFALVALLSWFGPAPRTERIASRLAGESADRIGSYLFVLATIGLAAILYLGFASYQLHTWCLLCMGTYVCVTGIFITSGITATPGLGRVPISVFEDLRQMTAKPIALIVSILYLAGAATLVAYFPREMKAPQAPPPASPQDVEKAFLDAWGKQPVTDLGIPADGAKVVVVKFNDWLCPACKGMHQAYAPVFDQFSKAHPGALKYVVKDWLWNTRCNANAPPTFPGHEGSCEAAAAVRMARDRGKESEMVNWLFDHQTELGELGLGSTDASNKASQAIKNQAAKMLGVTDFDREYAVKLQDIRRDEADAMAVQLSSTPTYFVNGVRTTVKGGPNNGANIPGEYMEMALRFEFNKKSAGK